MNRYRVSCALLLSVLLGIGAGGCGKFYWGKPGATAEQFARDNRECALEANQAPGGQVVREVFDRTYRACLMARGYGREQKVDPGSNWYRGIE